MDDYNFDDFDVDDFDDIEYNEEALQEQLFFAKEEYETWTREIEAARNYVMDIDELNNQNFENINKMREVTDKNDVRINSILDEKEALVAKMQLDNKEFMEIIDEDYRINSKKHEDKIQGYYDKLKMC